MLKQLLDSVLAPVPSLAPGRQTLTLPQFSRPIEFELVYSKKRTRVSLQVDVDGITCKAPIGTPAEYIYKLFEQKQHWLKQTLTRFQQFETSRLQWHTGGQFLYFGQWFDLTLISGSKFRKTLDTESQTLTFVIPAKVKKIGDYVKKKFDEFLYEQAEHYLVPRAEELAFETGLKPNKIELKIYQRRWGCCYKSGLIRLNPQLIGATSCVIDCVIIHELCHLTHLNHSRDFWRLNDKHCGKCKTNDDWLRHHAFALKN